MIISPFELQKEPFSIKLLLISESKRIKCRIFGPTAISNIIAGSSCSSADLNIAALYMWRERNDIIGLVWLLKAVDCLEESCGIVAVEEWQTTL